MSPILSRSATQYGGRPPAAIELTSEGVLAAALPGKHEPPVYAFEPLRPGILVPGISELNMSSPEAVSLAIRNALARSRHAPASVTVVIPDTAVRVFVLDFDSLPARASEAIPVLRFRLRKMVPFDVEHAGLSYQILSESKTEARVLVAILPSNILEEYETAVRAAGYEPGAVMPSAWPHWPHSTPPSRCWPPASARSPSPPRSPVARICCSIAPSTCPKIREQRLLEVQRSVAVAAAYYEDKVSVLPKSCTLPATEPRRSSNTGSAHPS